MSVDCRNVSICRSQTCVSNMSTELSRESNLILYLISTNKRELKYYHRCFYYGFCLFFSVVSPQLVNTVIVTV